MGVAGTGEADFLIYLSELLVKSGKQVAVFDDSPDKDIFTLLPFQEKEMIYTYHGVEYHRDIKEIIPDSPNHENQFIINCNRFDIVFFIIGSEGRKPSDYPAEVWYIFLTADRRKLEKTISIFEEQEVPVFLFIRNFCDYKITAAYIRGLWREARGTITGWYEIPFDMIDYEYAIRMQYEPVNEYKQLSKEIKEVLITVAGKLTGLTKREQEIIYKKLKRGKKRCR